MPAWCADAERHAAAEHPREACGLVVLVRGRLRYWPCRNAASDPGEHFVMDPADRVEAEDAGDVVGVFHSHPDAPATPSPDDRAACDADGVAWHILGADGWRTMLPARMADPLLGRTFEYGTRDCYALIRDWYAQERGIALPDFPRADGDFGAGRDLYRDGFPRAGFLEVCRTDVQPGDVLLFRLAAPVPDHGAIYLPGDRILHHLQGRLSSRDPLDGFLRERLVMVLRYAADDQAVR